MALCLFLKAFPIISRMICEVMHHIINVPYLVHNVENISGRNAYINKQVKSFQCFLMRGSWSTIQRWVCYWEFTDAINRRRSTRISFICLGTGGGPLCWMKIILRQYEGLKSTLVCLVHKFIAKFV